MASITIPQVEHSHTLPWRRTLNAAKMFIPPICLAALRRVYRRRKPFPLQWELAPHGFQTAGTRGWNEAAVRAEVARWSDFCRLISGSSALGVNHESPVASQKDLRAHNTIMSFAYVLATAARFKDRLSILDYGGGIGHYYAITKALMPNLEVDYHCQEIPLMAAAGKQILPQVTFLSQKPLLDRSYQMVMASGSLQYMENWKESTYNLTELAAEYLYITRLPIVSVSDSFTVIQRPYIFGYDSEWITWILNRSELISAVESRGFRLEREFFLEEGPVVPDTPERSAFCGFLFSCT